MKINFNQYDEEQTLHILESKPQYAGRAWQEEYFQICEKVYRKVHDFKNSLEACKAIFGKQQIVKQYSHRNWIWTFTDDDNFATIYCLVSVRGISWEYDKRSRKDHVIPLFREVTEAFVNYESNSANR